MNREQKIKRAEAALETVVPRPQETLTSVVGLGEPSRRAYAAFTEQVADLMADLMLLVEYKTAPVEQCVPKALDLAFAKFEADKMYGRTVKP